MLYIHKQSFDPWFNIAADEFILKQLQMDVCMVWRSTDCVVIGKHQHAFAEINRNWLADKNIPVIRRISGGGTVFHDENCLNYSFITNANKESDKINFDLFTLPIRKFLQSIGIDARLSQKSNLTVDGLKISGNAAHLFKNRSIHHGTLLFNSNLSNLDESIKPPELAYNSKAVQSKRVKVANIADFLTESIAVKDLQSKLIQFLVDWMPCEQERSLNPDEIKAISKLADEKYKNWTWTYGYSPDYQFEREINVHDELIKIELKVRKGMIASVESSNGKERKPILLLHNNLVGVRHNKDEIIERLHPLASEFAKNEEQFNYLINQIL